MFPVSVYLVVRPLVSLGLIGPSCSPPVVLLVDLNPMLSVVVSYPHCVVFPSMPLVYFLL